MSTSGAPRRTLAASCTRRSLTRRQAPSMPLSRLGTTCQTTLQQPHTRTSKSSRQQQPQLRRQPQVQSLTSWKLRTWQQMARQQSSLLWMAMGWPAAWEQRMPKQS